jgi:hypothetical protein
MTIGRFLSVAALTLVVGACGGTTPSEPAPSQQSVSDVLQRLSQDAIQQGYLEQGLMLGQAALASKFGVEPSVVAIKVGDASLRYRGFVAVMTLPGHDAIPAFQVRSFVGWTGEGDATKVLLVGSGADAASIVPLPSTGGMPDIRSSAVAMYMDGIKGARWAGSSGSVRLVEDSKGGPCPQAPTGMTCSTGAFTILLDGQLQMVTAADRNITAPLSIQRTVVNAVVLGR